MPENTDNEADLKPMKPEEARAQAAEFLGFPVGIQYDLGDGTTWTLPARSFMPADMRKRYTEHLRHIVEDLDTEEKANPVTGVTTTVAKWPNRIGGELIDEDELLCRALMGDDAYELFIAAGGVPGEVQVHWRVMDIQLQDRSRRDPKFR